MAKKGFTVIEIIIVVAIISVLSVYVGVSFATIAPRQLEAETRKLAADLSLARYTALQRHKNITVSFDTANKAYLIYETGQASFLERKRLNVDTVSVNSTPASIQFYYPKGTAQARQITLTYKGKSRQVTSFSDTGYIKWQ